MNKQISDKLAYTIIVLIACLLALLFFYLSNNISSQDNNGNITFIPEVIEDKDEPLYFSVMMDNHPDSRPPAGISSALIIYEALVEGGATKLLAIFNKNNLPDVIGPVRSVRPYFLTWANDYQGIFMHAGGSPQALRSLDKDDYQFVDVDEISYQGIYFYRDYTKTNPHNLFTKAELIDKAWDKYIAEGKRIDFEWDTKEDLLFEFRPTADKYIKIPYPLDDYEVIWHYDRLNNDWQRFINNNAQLDVSGEILTAKNVVILLVDTWLIDIERLGMKTIGRGGAYLFRDGQKQEIIWQKKDLASPLQLVTDEAKVKLNIGNVWFQVLPSYLQIEYN